MWPIDETVIGAATLGQGGPESNGSEGVIHTPQISKTGASQSNAA